MSNPIPGFILDVQEIKAGLVAAKADSTEAPVIAHLDQLMLDVDALLLLMIEEPDKTIREVTMYRGERDDEVDEAEET